MLFDIEIQYYLIQGHPLGLVSTERTKDCDMDLETVSFAICLLKFALHAEYWKAIVVMMSGIRGLEFGVFMIWDRGDTLACISRLSFSVTVTVLNLLGVLRFE